MLLIMPHLLALAVHGKKWAVLTLLQPALLVIHAFSPWLGVMKPIPPTPIWGTAQNIMKPCAAA
jgi:hypothetical protein